MNSVYTKDNDDYYPFGMSFNSNNYGMGNDYLFNGGSKKTTDLGLDLYNTPNRFYDPNLGRFWGVDAMADMFTSVTPMNFGFNNPIKFNDPMGLAGEEGDDDEKTIELPTHTVTATSLVKERDFSFIYQQLMDSHNPIKRNLGSVIKNEGIEKGQELFNRGRKLHYSYYERVKYYDMKYLNAFRKLYTYGVSGSMVVIVGSPFLLETIASSGLSQNMVRHLFFGPKLSFSNMIANAGVEFGSQLLSGTPIQGINYFDIASQSVLGFNSFGSIIASSLINYKPLEGGSYLGWSITTGDDLNIDMASGGFSGTLIDKVAGRINGVGGRFISTIAIDLIIRFNANQLKEVEVKNE